MDKTYHWKHAMPYQPIPIHKVILNLPANDSFNPPLRRVYKWDTIHNHPVAGMNIYVNDLRTIATIRELGWYAVKRTLSRLQYVDIANTPRNRILENGS